MNHPRLTLRLTRALPVFAALCCGLAVLAATTAAAADLRDHGPNGEFFFDPSSGRYWFDPAAFVGLTRGAAAYIDAYHPDWSWATSAQIDSLLGRTSPSGSSLLEVMGPDQVPISGYRWVGYYAETTPNGWLVQTTNGPAYDTITATSGQANADPLNPGAWFVSRVDPVTAPRLENVGDDGEFFYDHATELFWHDPARFVGLTRDDVEDWLAEHPEWRWASAAEVFGLLCRLTAGDVPLEDILGARQYTSGADQPRWIGYYEQASAPDGLLLQCGYGPPYVIATLGSTQTNVATWNPGAWVVAETNPTRAVARTWNGVKRVFE